MRFLSILLGVLGAVVGLVFAYSLFALTMLAGGGKPWLAQIFFGIALALALASILALVGGLLNPRKPAATWLSVASGSVWVIGAAIIVIAKLLDESAPGGLIDALKFAAIVAAPCILPFANAALSLRQSRTSA